MQRSSSHTVSTTGDLELHTVKLEIWLPGLSIVRNVTAFDFTKSNITIGYLKCDIAVVKFYFKYLDIQKISLETITICTENSWTTNKQCITIGSYSLSIAEWNNFAHIERGYLGDSKVRLNIFIKILHKQDGPNFSNLLIDPIYSDATIVSNDGVAIKVHKCIVADRCDVFKVIFTHSSSSAIQSDFEENVLRELLKYIYCGIKAVDKDLVTETLFIAADFYQLNELKNFIEYSLYEKLTENNVIDSLIFANTHSAVHLKKFAMAFIDSHASVIFTKPAWADLNSTEILKALYENTMKNETIYL